MYFPFDDTFLSEVTSNFINLDVEKIYFCRTDTYKYTISMYFEACLPVQVMFLSEVHPEL